MANKHIVNEQGAYDPISGLYVAACGAKVTGDQAATDEDNIDCSDCAALDAGAEPDDDFDDLD